MHKDENSLPGAGTKLVGGVDQDGSWWVAASTNTCSYEKKSCTTGGEETGDGMK